MGINTHTRRELQRERDAYAERVRERGSEEPVVYGEAHSRGSGAHPQLVVDGVEVPVDGAGAEEEPLGNLGVGESFGHKP